MSDWLTYSQTTGSGDTNITITASSGNASREQVIKVYNQNKSINVRLRQFVITSEWLTAVLDLPSAGSHIIFSGYIIDVLRYRVDGGEWIIPTRYTSSYTEYKHNFSTSGRHIVEYDTYENGISSDAERPYTVPDGLFSKVVTNRNDFYVTDVYIPSKYIAVAGIAFFCNFNIEHVYWTNSVTKLGDGLFYVGAEDFPEKLTSISLPDNLQYIPPQFLNNREEVSAVTISPTCTATYIGYYAFSPNKISSIVIPQNVQAIYQGAFAGCRYLTDIYAYPTTAPALFDNTGDPNRSFSINEYPFNNIKTNGVLHYPAGSDYSSWLQNTKGFLGYYGWTGVADL